MPSATPPGVDLEAFGLLDSILKAETDLAVPLGETSGGGPGAPEGGQAMRMRADAAEKAAAAIAPATVL